MNGSSTIDRGCQLIREQFESYIDGELAPNWRVFLRRHLEECRICRDLIYNTARLKGRIRSAVMNQAMPPGFPKALLSKVRKEFVF